VLHAWLLAAVLLLAQGVGMAHRFAHAPSAGDGWSQDHEAGGAECRLIDQLAHADALCGGNAPVPGLVRVSATASARPAGALAIAAPAAYLARAPPRG
jgi:hypothetical protein